jgi:hypothetical protein
MTRSILMAPHRSIITGTSFQPGAKALLAKMRDGDQVTLIRDKANQHDYHAVAVHFQGHRLGYIPRSRNGALSAFMDSRNLTELTAKFLTPQHHLDDATVAWVLE